MVLACNGAEFFKLLQVICYENTTELEIINSHQESKY